MKTGLRWRVSGADLALGDYCHEFVCHFDGNQLICFLRVGFLSPKTGEFMAPCRGRRRLPSILMTPPGRNAAFPAHSARIWAGRLAFESTRLTA